MAVECKGICERWMVHTTRKMNNRRYIIGHKRCTRCEMWLKCDGYLCPCCHGLLRCKPHNTKAKKDYAEVMRNS